MKDDFIDFMQEKAEVPKYLFEETKQIIKISTNPKSTITKFYLLQIGGMFLTLFFCPQYGFKSIGFNGIMNWVMDLGPVYCAAFCSTVFFAGGLLVSNIFMSKAELKWVFGHKASLILPFNSAIFFLMMSTKEMAMENHMLFHGISFDVTWILTSFVVAFLMLEATKLKMRKVSVGGM